MQVRVVDFFAGCGGMSLGFAAANHPDVTYRVVGGVEIDPYAASTYERALGVPVHVGDVRELLDPVALQRASEAWQGDGPLLLIACAPCQGFSSHRKKDVRTDARNGLLADLAVRDVGWRSGAPPAFRPGASVAVGAVSSAVSGSGRAGSSCAAHVRAQGRR